MLHGALLWCTIYLTGSQEKEEIMKNIIAIIVLAAIAVVAIALPSPNSSTAICNECGKSCSIESMAQMSGENSIVFICKDHLR